MRVVIRRGERYDENSATMYSGMTARNAAIIRVVTRNGTDGTPMTSRASISSLIRIAPSRAVKPHPTVAASAIEATNGATSRVLKYAEMNAVNLETPIWLSDAYP